ncbi:MAG TPA: restriction endonuclease subunit S [Terriglobia bacterium]|nr:restriction endonuclease subunit S [Terriglobia bacterium]
MAKNLPNGWIRTTLGEVCAINPRMPFDESLPDSTEVSFVPMSAVEEESGRLDASHTRALGSVRRGYTPFIENDVIFAKITPCMENGKIALASGLMNGFGYGSTEFFVFRPYGGVLPRFVLYFLLQPTLRQAAESQMTGASGQKRVPANYLFTHEFRLPPTREQERIVVKLDAAVSKLKRAGIAAHRAQERLKRYRAAVLQAAAIGELSRPWREAKRNNQRDMPRTAGILLQSLLDTRRRDWEKADLERLRDNGKTPEDDRWKSRYPEPVLPNTDNVPELPPEWTWVSLDQVLSALRNGISQAPREEDGLPILRISAVRPMSVDLTECRHLPVSTVAKYKDYVLQEGDLLFTRYNGSRDLAGVCGQVPSTSLTVVYPDKLIRGVPVKSNEQTSTFITIAANSGASRQYIEAHLFTTAGQWGISGRNLKFTPLPLPPADEQAHIVREVRSRLSAVDRLEAALEKQLDRARTTHHSLLREAFSGRLVPQEISDEPASVLLNHIRAEKARKDAERHGRRRRAQPARWGERDSMKDQPPSSESLIRAWERIGRKADARRLFDEAGFGHDNVVQFYEALRATPQILTAFQKAARGSGQQQKSVRRAKDESEQPSGHFRLVELWLADFKNLKDYTVRFNPTQGLDVVLGWNGTGKSNLFEALVIIFRDLHEWWEKNRWPDKPMNGYRLSYEMDEHIVEVTWRPEQMKRPELKRGLIPRKAKTIADLESIKREQLPLPRFVFGYYSGPTNRLAEHFLPMSKTIMIAYVWPRRMMRRLLRRCWNNGDFFVPKPTTPNTSYLGFPTRKTQKSANSWRIVCGSWASSRLYSSFANLFGRSRGAVRRISGAQLESCAESWNGFAVSPSRQWSCNKRLATATDRQQKTITIFSYRTLKACIRLPPSIRMPEPFFWPWKAPIFQS